ncbi:MAG TPA: glycosyltransferase family 4 protein [Parafilimonas sp.]|nr:glycosyltransferase family 4 protein [Parafilimonas sp.]
MYKIVQVVPALGWGGAQVFCIQLCNELAKKAGYEITLISMYDHQPGKHLPLSMLDNSVKFISLGKKPGIDPVIFFKVYKTLKKIKPDVVHTHLHAGYYCFYAYKRVKYPFKKVHTIHNLAREDAPHYIGRKMFKYFFKRNIIEAVTVSEEVYKSAVKEYGTCIKTLIHNGANAVRPTAAFTETQQLINGLKKNTGTKVLLNIARITRQKNQKLLLDVMRMLQEQNIIAIIAGSYVQEDENLYNELVSDTPANVHFVGKVSNIGDYLLCADAFVLTSIFEGLPISLLEALSAGVIPVCTPVGGIVNVITKDTGFLSDGFSKEAYLGALKLYLNTSESNRMRLQDNGKKLYNGKFSMHACASAYDNLYHTA